MPTQQYSIRRIEFDRWLLDLAAVPFYHHKARHIRQENSHYVIDEAFKCRYIVGAGGTNCPIYHSVFRGLNPRAKEDQIVCLEEEFTYPRRDAVCHLWFFDEGLTGYSWFVPKGEGVVNIGIGGKLASMRSKGQTIRDHWQRFQSKLERLGLVTDHDFRPKGYQYYLRGDVAITQAGRAYVIGDAAGLATKDMGEGIGPAVESGLLAAASILSGQPYTTGSIGKYSLPGILTARVHRT
jgi:flavin-dependent dehydrogenase